MVIRMCWGKKLYKNEHKGFMLTASAEASLEDVHALMGASKLLHHQIEVCWQEFLWIKKRRLLITKYGLQYSFYCLIKRNVADTTLCIDYRF